MKKTLRSIKQLKADPNNLRAHNPRNLGMIQEALQEVGAARSIVIDEHGQILAGNGTVDAATKAGITKLRVVDADGDTIIAVRRTGLTDRQKQQLALYDNRTAETATWDASALAELLEQDSTALDGLFSEKEIKAIITEDVDRIVNGGNNSTVDTHEAKLNEWQAKWKTAAGQIWKLGDHRLACGSATHKGTWAKLMKGQKAALVFTDPPYGVSYQSATTGKIQNDDLRQNALTGLLKPAFEQMVANAADTAAFYIWHASATRRDFEWAMDAAGLQENQYLSWVKDSFVLGHADYHWQTEPCQPAGTMVRKVINQRATEKGRQGAFATTQECPIETLKDGDTVVSYNPAEAVVHARGRTIKVTKREYDGEIYTVAVDSKKTKATDGHQFTVRYTKESQDTWNTYLMRRGAWWRIGILRTFNSRGFGPRIRLEQELGEEIWILNSHKTKTDAMVEEQILSISYGIPTTHWETGRHPTCKTDARTAEQIARIYNAMDLGYMRSRAIRLLEANGRKYQYPTATKDMEYRCAGTPSRLKTIRVRACNLMPGIMEIPIPTKADEFKWVAIESIERNKFTGSVYSMDVERDQHYIADGIITHNCFYAQKAGQRAAFFGNRKQSTIWRISRSATDPGTTVNLANGLHLSDGGMNSLYLKPNVPKGGKALRHLRLEPDQAIAVITSAATDAWEIKRDTSSEYIHPNQKPPELAIRAIINSTPTKEAIVVDCFAGSGSTLISCERTSRQFRGIELDPKFAAAILERWSAETGQTPKQETK